MERVSKLKLDFGDSTKIVRDIENSQKIDSSELHETVNENELISRKNPIVSLAINYDELDNQWNLGLFTDWQEKLQNVVAKYK